MRSFRINLAIAITSIVFGVSFSGLYAQGEPGNKVADAVKQETYFGQSPPGKKAVAFAPDVLTSEAHDSPVILPDEACLLYQGMETEILFYGMSDGRLVATKNPLGIKFPDTCNGVAISPSGDRFFIEEWKAGRPRLYYCDRKEAEWTSPIDVDLGEANNWWQISVARSGSLYLASDKVMLSSLVENAYGRPIPLKLEDGNDMMGATPFISPDESYIIYSIDGDLYISYRRDDGKWTMPRSLGPDINSDQLDICPQITPNGKYLLFNTRREFPRFRIYWADASFVETLRPKEW